MSNKEQKTYYVNELNKLEEELSKYDSPQKKIYAIKYYICQHDLKKYLPLMKNIIPRPRGRPITSTLKEKYPEHSDEELRIQKHETIEYYFQDFYNSYFAFDALCQESDHWRKDYDKKKYLYEFIRSLFITIEKIEQIELINPLQKFLTEIGCIYKKEQELISYFEQLKTAKWLRFDDINLIDSSTKIIVQGDANKNILAIFEELESNGIITNLTGNYTGKGRIKKHAERITKYFIKSDGKDFSTNSLISMRTNNKYNDNKRFKINKTNIPHIKK